MAEDISLEANTTAKSYAQTNGRDVGIPMWHHNKDC